MHARALPAAFLLLGIALLAGLLAASLRLCPCAQVVEAPVVALPPPLALETPEQILERKRLFVAMLLPILQAENRRLLVDRERISRIEAELAREDEISRDDFTWLKRTAERYDLDPRARRNPEFFDSLRKRVDVVPAGLLIAQAAIESGWGRSMIARESHNYFGHYCFSKDCGVPAPGAGDLRVFASPADSVHAYMHNLNSHPAYRQWRGKRAELRRQGLPLAGTALAGALTAYSERGDAYVADVLAVIRANRLDSLANH